MSQRPSRFLLSTLPRPPPTPAPAAAPTPTSAPIPAPRPPFIRPALNQIFARPPTNLAQPPSAPPPAAPTPPSPPEVSTPPPAAPPPQPSPPPATISPPSQPIPPQQAATEPHLAAPLPIKPSIPTPKPSPPLPPQPASFSPTLSPSSPTHQSPKPSISVPSTLLPTKTFSSSPPPLQPPPITESPTATIITTAPSPQISKPTTPKATTGSSFPTPPKNHLSSPKTKPLTPPPSPLTLPPSQISINSDDHQQNSYPQISPPSPPPETEQKIVMVNENTLVDKPKDKPAANHHHHSPKSFSAHAKKEKCNHKKFLDSQEEIGMMSMITLVGENRGAIMELIPHSAHHNNSSNISSSKLGFAAKNHKNENHRLQSQSSSDGEKLAIDSEGMKMMNNKDKINHKSNRMTPFRSYTNSNVQGANNSILYNSSCTYKDPGVHLSLSRKPKLPNHEPRPSNNPNLI